MDFDFSIFSGMVEKAYSDLPDNWPYTLMDTLRVFHLYLHAYEITTGEPHPHVKMEQVKSMVKIMPYIDQEDIGNVAADIMPEEYAEIINRHFNTRYQRGCNYRLGHFFSGEIRKNRWYECG